MESNEPMLTSTGMRLLYNDTSGMPKLANPFNINVSKTADSKNESYAYYTDNKKYDKYDEKTFKQYLDSLI